MATQRLIIAAIAGNSAKLITRQMQQWRQTLPMTELAAVDRFCDRLRDHVDSMPIVYYCEWIDRWLMADRVPGPYKVHGQRYQLATYSRAEAHLWADGCNDESQEEHWLASRLREAATAWSLMADEVVILVVRDVISRTVTDEYDVLSLGEIPDWLTTN